MSRLRSLVPLLTVTVIQSNFKNIDVVSGVVCVAKIASPPENINKIRTYCTTPLHNCNVVPVSVQEVNVDACYEMLQELFGASHHRYFTTNTNRFGNTRQKIDWPLLLA
jgi:hypothetical protein